MGTERDSLKATLDAVAGLDIAFDATITPQTLLAGGAGSAASAEAAPESERQPLPQLSLSYPTMAAAESGAPTPALDHELRLTSLLGEGGMGRVFLAEQRSLRREVAVKTTKEAAPTSALSALHDEAIVTGSLEHPGIIPVHALGRDDEGRPVLVMKRIEGVCWRDLLHDSEHAFFDELESQGDRLDFHLDVMTQVCHALAFAHSRGLVHRDIKPDNVMIGRFGEVYLVDWGLATQVGTASPTRSIVGTPAYMAPEMLTAEVDERTDVYLLGATLHEVLTGAPPHGGSTLAEVILAAFESAPKAYPASVPSELAELCQAAMTKDPTLRPESAAEVRQRIAEHGHHRASRALSATALERLGELRHLVEDFSADERDLAAARRLITECVFGLRQAEREWPTNPAVPPGLAACLALSARLELDRGDLEAARAAVAQLPEPVAELTRALAELDEQKLAEAEEQARLRSLAHDLDPTVNASSRSTAALVIGVAVVVLTTYAFYAIGSREQGAASSGPTNEMLLGFAALSGAFMLGILAYFGPKILTNKFNRQFAGWCAVLTLTLLGHRALSWSVDADPVHVLRMDLVLFTSAFAIGGVVFFRWLYLGAAALALAAVHTALWPEHILWSFTVGSSAAIGLFAIFWRKVG